MDRDTVLGAMQFLFYKMIKFYPKAHRFYVFGHKTSKITTNGTERIRQDYTIRKNSENYTMTEMYEAFRVVCKLYGVVVIDVFEKGIIKKRKFSESK